MLIELDLAGIEARLAKPCCIELSKLLDYALEEVINNADILPGCNECIHIDLWIVIFSSHVWKLLHKKVVFEFDGLYAMVFADDSYWLGKEVAFIFVCTDQRYEGVLGQL